MGAITSVDAFEHWSVSAVEAVNSHTSQKQPLQSRDIIYNGYLSTRFR